MSKKVRDRTTRGVIAALQRDGWFVARKGPGDHVQFKHPRKPGKVTVDTGEPEIPTEPYVVSIGRLDGLGDRSGRDLSGPAA
ncbi:addiction module toxin, HicA family [Methylobacterium sp. WL64]|uniref:type II toxin-antitoxin system HicA family toxin n=1 Tax=Methylobacterium sp. WL64 TaxID=2603894 RepID=UPI0011C7A693|nr:type II toxin-antitoxin system HicA family toxin [Methylobacterium sp. WL64]TXM99328.1 addiction module toxin, HicA family [Methylobacterium sp. WL64]